MTNGSSGNLVLSIAPDRMPAEGCLVGKRFSSAGKRIRQWYPFQVTSSPWPTSISQPWIHFLFWTNKRVPIADRGEKH